ncbi:MAG: helix-turn-helix domain-containing protein [Pseudomonadota bacterium]
MSEHWIDMPAYIEMGRGIETSRGDPLSALRLGTAYRPQQSGLIGYLSQNQPTLRDALLSVCHNVGLVMRGARFTLAETRPIASLTYDIQMPTDAIRFDVDFTMSAMVAMLRSYHPDVRIAQVSLRGQPRFTAEEMRGLLRAPCILGQETNAAYFEAQALDQPLEHADSDLLQTLERLMGLVSIDRGEDSLIVRVREAIAQHLSDGTNTIEAVCDALCMTRRTLQRHLTLHGHSFSSIRDQVRKERALAMLRQTTLPISEVAYRVGFSEVSAFFRACRNWTGVSPGKYRAAAHRQTGKERPPIAMHRPPPRD